MTPPAPIRAAAPAPGAPPRAAAPPAAAVPPVRAPQPAAPAAAPVAGAPPIPAGDLVTAWQRVVEEVMSKRAMLGALLAQARPLRVTGGELALDLTVGQFQREMLADQANREIVVQAIRRSIAGADRFTLASDTQAGLRPDGGSGGGPAAHPAVQAAIAEFGGEVVAVRPRPREGEGQ